MLAPMPRPAAIVQLLALALFAAFQAYGVWCAVNPFTPPDSEPPNRMVGLAIWKMFAPYDPTNWRVDFEGKQGEAWVPLPMTDWVPRTPDGTLLWEKAMILRTPSFRVPFLEEACARSGRPAVRAVWRSWPKVPGQPVDSAPVSREKVLATRTCGQLP